MPRSLAASLREQHPDFGRDVAIDASDIPAWANGHGPSTTEARSASGTATRTHPGVTVRGVDAQGRRVRSTATRSHVAVCTVPACRSRGRRETARSHESLFVAPLLDAVRARGFRPETCAMDKGYDNTRVYGECEARGVDPVIPLRGAKSRQ